MASLKPSPEPNRALHDFKLSFGHSVHPLMCHYESFITCYRLCWPLMIQQNYFINAFPHTAGVQHRAAAVAAFACSGRCPRVCGQRHGELCCLQTACLAVSAAWSDTSRSSMMWGLAQSWWGCAGSRAVGRGCSCPGLSSSREGPWRASWYCCACSLCWSAPPVHCMHVSDLFSDSWRGFCKAAGKECMRQGKEECWLGPAPSLSWGWGRNSRATLPKAELVCPLYCCFAHSCLTSCKVNWLARIWMLIWACTFSASSSVTSRRKIGKLYWDKWQNQEVSAFVQAGRQILSLSGEAAETQTSPKQSFGTAWASTQLEGRGQRGYWKQCHPCSETSITVRSAKGFLWAGWMAEQKNAGSYKCFV